MVRDETTLVASSYAQRLPANLSGRDAFVLDPMLATGGTMEATIRMLLDRGAASVTAVCLVAAPAGIQRVNAAFAGAEQGRIWVVTAAIDPELNQHGYIVPGLGDAGDRLFGPAE
jgi:uracil phosphoribosyltransferase